MNYCFSIGANKDYSVDDINGVLSGQGTDCNTCMALSHMHEERKKKDTLYCISGQKRMSLAEQFLIWKNSKAQYIQQALFGSL